MTGVFMSLVISEALSEREYTRTSSISPPKNSLANESPPKRRGDVDAGSDPAASVVERSVPLTYMRTADPSNVSAR
jgi:hypothetical protein